MQSFCIQCMYCFVRLYNRLFSTNVEYRKHVSSSHLPWMWIGAELTDGSIRTITELVESTIDYGDCVTPEFLETVAGSDNVSRWLYLDSKTLKEEEIPATGLIIEDDSV